MCCDASIVVTVFNNAHFAFCFSIYVVMLALWSPSSIAAHFAFCYTSCVVMLAFWSPSTTAHFAFFLLVVIKSGIGTQGELSQLLKVF